MSEEEIDLTHSILYRGFRKCAMMICLPRKGHERRMKTCVVAALWRPQIAQCSHARIHLLISGPAGTTTAGHSGIVNRNPCLTKELTIAALADSGSEMALRVPVGATTDFALTGV